MFELGGSNINLQKLEKFNDFNNLERMGKSAVQRSMCPDRIANTEHKRDTGPDPSGKGPGRGSARQGVQGFGLISFFVQMLILSPCTDP
jgi:hypothetical protein